MKKKIFRDYIKSFRWSQMCKTNPTINNLSFFYIYIYLCVYPLIIGRSNDSLSIHDIMNYLLCLFWVMLVSLNAMAVAIRLPKQMYLIPMSRMQRKEYLTGLLQLKLAIPMLLSGSGVAIYCGIIGLPAIFILMNVIGICSFSICTAITSWPGSILFMHNGAIYEKKRRQLPEQLIKIKQLPDKELKKLPIFSGLGIGLGIVEVFLGIIAMEVRHYDNIRWQIGLGLLTGFLIIMDAKVLRYAKPVIEIAADYEKTIGMDFLLGEKNL